MKSTAEEFEEIKQELLVLQKRIELVEEQAKLNEMKTKPSSTIEWKYASAYNPDNMAYTTTPKGDTIHFDKVSRSSYSDIN